ncbi:hypothetical protein QNI23_013925 [Bermanella sp. WJH001]|uniref:hypothetical protein n=1 Tax=Bermanella sp. WJH001 TaxID=3048005 RepID=UPI0024BE4230|nr:hypothetical protein [Bermanella sp. WJH001]MDJ1538091.1 hypothetical protein [Bermanella sp. WJH001]
MYAHGHYDLWLDNHVVLARIKGQWNEDMAKQFSQALKDISAPLTQGAWAHIVYLDDWELGTPDIEPVIKDLAIWAIQHGLKRSAQVYSPNMLKQYQMDRMVQQAAGEFERRIFSEEEHAFSWLKDEGFSVKREHLLPISA